MKLRTILASALAAAGIAAGVGYAIAQEKLKIGFVYVGPVGDHGWTYQHDVARKALEQTYGTRIETTFVEKVAEGPDAERVIEQLARSGHRLIFTTSFGYMDPTERVARRFPNVRFEHATGFKRANNLATYAGRFYEGRYILGQIAARMSKTGTVGYIGSFAIPEVVSGINAFMLGAQSIRPDIKVKIVWVNSWYDPGKEADAAKALADQGADILSQHTDSPAAMQIAEQRGILAFGQDSDMLRFGPRAQLTSIVNDWVPYYTERVKLMLEGNWRTGDTWGGLNTGMVHMAAYTNMPADVKAMAEATEAAIKAGTLHPFRCPVVRQDGTTVECKGNGVLADEQILGMNFYIRGIDDRVPSAN
ncbi:BMP family ABC transporter substrate-binding protein [Phreatobacter aquaticus]|uniref:BMP family ABC transporter substrate-binding protein n=1 Tax=Phreatobacter aquaticus TaxID=2570229 RepID=A0A4D7QBN4_9HYPH|nr:BMP family ABC transporter substrate-binding protein [Phreatobacter aquaticus]QCK85450.1 BMP family ABC transporter substrate-binding protein [Phreatobacter aquaticus]